MTANEYRNKIHRIVENGITSLGISMGTRLGLFEGLSKLSQSKETAVTSQQLADSLNYKERYVREWINGMALSGILCHAEVEGVDKYWVEPHTLPTLLGDNLTWVAQLTEMVTGVAENQELVERCFPVSGPRGTAIDDYPVLHEFHLRKAIMWKSPEIICKIFSDGKLVSMLEQGIRVVEMACGPAMPTKALAMRYPKSQFHATDISMDNLERAKVTCQGLDNVKLSTMDACNIPADMNGRVDLVMLLEAYHELPYPDKMLAGIIRILKPGGMFLLSDINVHESVSNNKKHNAASIGMYYTVSSLYCMPTSYKFPGGAGLGACAGKELYERKLKEMFSDVKLVAEDIGLYFLCTK